MPRPTTESVDSQKTHEVKIRSAAPAREGSARRTRMFWRICAADGSPTTRHRKASARGLQRAGRLRTLARADCLGASIIFPGRGGTAARAGALDRKRVRGALKTDGTGPALIGMFAVIIAIGGLVYIMLVDRIFAQGQPAAATTVDASAAPPTAPTAPVAAENPPVAATPATTESASNDRRVRCWTRRRRVWLRPLHSVALCGCRRT